MSQQEAQHTAGNAKQFLFVYGSILVSLVSLTLLVIGIVSNWHTFTTASNIFLATFLFSLIVLLPLFVIGACIYIGITAYVAIANKQEELKAKQDERRRRNEEHTVNMHLAKTRLAADERGNRPYIYDELTASVTQVASGNFVQAAPHTYAPRIDYRHEAPAPEQQQQPYTTVSEIAAPTMQEVYALLGYNNLQTCLGVSTTTGKPFILPMQKGVHYKILGSSGFGKSCSAASMLDQLTQTNDPEHLLIALLDLEHKTSRLFENVPHIAELSIGHKRIQCLATSADDVATQLGYLRRELDRRTKLTDEGLRRERFLLIYVEEFLSLKFEVDEDLKAQMLKDFSILAVRGRKYGMYLLACAQTDYADTDLKEAKGQFRVKEAFNLEPNAARSAGFVRSDLIKQNYIAQTPGQFVLETGGCMDIMFAPHFDIEAKLLEIDRPHQPTNERVYTSHLQQKTVLESNQHQHNTAEHDPTTEQTPTVTPTLTPALEAKLATISELQNRNYSQTEIIEKIWNVKKGTSAKYHAAREEYLLIDAAIQQRKKSAVLEEA